MLIGTILRTTYAIDFTTCMILKYQMVKKVIAIFSMTTCCFSLTLIIICNFGTLSLTTHWLTHNTLTHTWTNKELRKHKKNKLHARVGSENSEVVWSGSTAFHRLQQLDTAVGHWQHLHTSSYTTLHTDTRTHTHRFIKNEYSIVIIILQGLLPLPMQGRDGRSIFPMFLWLQRQ